MNVAIRVDASSEIGIGHVMRCLTLARLLQNNLKVNIVFVCNSDIPVSLIDEIKEKNFELILIKKQELGSFSQTVDSLMFYEVVKDLYLDWVIIDHYLLDFIWEQAIKPYTKHIFVIDDLANRKHVCEILLDQNLYPNIYKRYEALVPNGCKLLLGPEFLLLREDFRTEPQPPARIDCRHVLVNFGGSDPTNEIDKVLHCIEDTKNDFKLIHFHLIAGPANPNQSELEKRCSYLTNVTFYREYKSMAKLLTKIDLCIGAGGISLWERCFMGVPSIVITVADNQIESVREAEKHGLIWNLGDSSRVDSQMISELLKQIQLCPILITEKSRRAMAFMQPLRNSNIHPIISMMRQF
jgi:UDP-2,4-diacetamido-2,4,6-trideoxy-beta-L-altropyranose hydrolase